LIEKYHNEVIKCIRLIYYSKSSKLSLQQKLTFFAETRHSFGHTALMLSGGATFGKYHFGVIKALYEYDLLPRTICGASVGSLVAAAICAKPYD
jgi:predicted acylesterase/phospholipase RssA